MPKSEASTNMQEWKNVFKPGTSPHIYDTSKNIWNGSALLGKHTEGKIPKFEKVTTLNDFCETQGQMRKQKPTGDRKLEVFCIV